MITNGRSLTLRSYAKINLFLDVLGKRPDGYHQIRTIFHEIKLHDTLNFTLTKKSSLKILTNTDFVSTRKNLIYKVAIFIQKRYNVDYGVEIKLEKNIPVAGGLGGGSSNAAATIKALSEIWELSLTPEEEHNIAKNFGSDINFFLLGGTALGEGRGEIITPLADIRLDNLLLVKPSLGIFSREAYHLVKPVGSHNQSWREITSGFKPEMCFNRLQSGICQSYPEIERIIDQLLEQGAIHSLLSGSGSTVIGFFRDQVSTQRAAEFFSGKNYWNCITQTKERSTK
ncbi:MAG: 4-(cytidine 5'-diphospho)-2-C-methyl-D-erythritol kinase [Candidatus Cloacimonetes bacterium]|nr:4-(cytidine 5'-diphospho)-2-C-methyl-D-erythritol kinase [Candidatus Cloacimonadota bacterium]